jgi:hypothetical protein
MADRKFKNELDSDFRLIGIATPLKEYKLCFYLNQILGCDFRKLEPITFEPKDRGRKAEFSVFKADEQETNNAYVVFTNKNAGDFLLPEVSNFDYIMQITGKFTAESLKKLINSIMQASDVVLTTEIPVKKIKSKERLIFFEEKPVQTRFKNNPARNS